MFFLERYIKKLKGFVRQREKPEGSMAEGYISYESFYYASEYIKQIDNRPGAVIWDDERDEHKREGDLLQTSGKKRLIKSKRLIFFQIYKKYLIFMLNFDIMNILISKYYIMLV